VLISAEDLDAMEATRELPSDPAAMERVRQALNDLAAGQGTQGQDMAELMERRRGDRAGR
jgi:PHD/YefM family antitoxin component YafN of YafNO toxin-antitoxin module